MIPEQFRLIATSAALVRAAGPAGAIWVGNAIAAQEWSEREHKDPWWHATKSEIEERTGLSSEMQETARRRLRDLGVLEERRGVLKRGASLATIWYCLDVERLAAIVYRETRQTAAGNTGNRSPENPANDHASGNTSGNTVLPPTPQGGRKRDRKGLDVEEFDPLIPLHFQAPEFLDAWHGWVADRHERKIALTERAARNEIEDLVRGAGTPEAAVAWIRNAITKRYRGIFPPTPAGRPTAPHARSATDAHLMDQLATRGQGGVDDGRAPAF